MPAVLSAARVPPDDRPRERLLRAGPAALGDEDLLAIILGAGVRDRPARQVAADLVRATGGLAALSRASAREIAQITGIGEARATRIAAAFELGRRAVSLVHHRPVVACPADVHRLVAPRLAGQPQEVFVVIGLDVRNGLLDIVEIARGTIHSVEVHPREVFRPLIRMAAAGGVVVHNHPSGDPTPSPEDLELTRRLREAGRMLGVPIIDHVVIGDHAFSSTGEWLDREGSR